MQAPLPIRTYVEVKLTIEIKDAQALWDRALAKIAAAPISRGKGHLREVMNDDEQDAIRCEVTKELGSRERPNIGACCLWLIAEGDLGFGDDAEHLEPEVERVYDAIFVDDGPRPRDMREFIHERKLVDGREQGDGV